jgi:NADPH:quinone reductase-like Zn-dependent oxidoreductase
VSYGEPSGLGALFRILATLILVNVLPNGKSFKLYGTSFYFVGNKRPFLEDWAALFKLLEEGKIKPVIAKTFPIPEAAQANALLETGQVIGNVVLVAPELLEVGVPKDRLPEEHPQSALLSPKFRPN